MGQLLAFAALVMFLTASTPAKSATKTKTDDCNWFVEIANENKLPPYDFGVSLSLFCDPDNDYYQSINEILDKCKDVLNPSFYNPLRLGFGTGQIYMQGFNVANESQAELISAILQLSSMSAESDNCTALQEAADLLFIKPYDLGLTLSVFCEPANDYCKELNHGFNTVCFEELPSKFYKPLVSGCFIGRALMTFIYEQSEDPRAAHERLAATLSSRYALPDTAADDCNIFQEFANVFDLDPFSAGLTMSMLCDDSVCKNLIATSEHCREKMPPAFHAPLDAGLNLGLTYRQISEQHDIPSFDARRHGCSWFPKMAKLFHLQPYGLGASLEKFCDPTTDSCRQMDDLLNNVCVDELAPKFYVPLRTGRVYKKRICVV